MYGPWKPAWRPPRTSSRKVRTYVSFLGERLSAKKALERFPKLRKFLLGSKNLTQSTLEARLRKFCGKGQIPFDTILNYNIVQDATRRLRVNTVSHHVLENPDKGAPPRDFLENVRDSCLDFFGNNTNNKIQILLRCGTYRRDAKTGEMTVRRAVFNSEQHSVFPNTNLDDVYTKMAEKVVKSFVTYTRKGSGWILKSIEKLDITLSKLNPLREGSYISLPECIKTKEATINMKNLKDDECFKWAITRALNPVEVDPQRITKKLRERTSQKIKLGWYSVSYSARPNDV